jgi:dienelactone hydrolase
MAGHSRPDYDEAPARLTFLPLPAHEPGYGLACERLELCSRGDIVTGVRARPAAAATGSTTKPGALLLVHDAGSHARGDEWRAVSGWVVRGLHAVALDLPLHGLRASPKLSERLLGSIDALARGVALDRNGQVLVEEALRQAGCDVGRALEGLLALEGIDPQRVGLVGVGLGARVSEALVAASDRLRAAVLVRTRRSGPVAGGSAAAGRDALILDGTKGDGDWTAEAERFLGSRLGF